MSGSLFDGAMQDQRVRLYRQDDQSQRWLFHGHLTPEDATEDFVSQLFGGGRWRAQLMRRDPQGREVVQKSIDFKIPGGYVPPTGRLPGAVAPVAPVEMPAPAAVGFRLREVSAGGSGVPQLSPNEMLNQVLLNQVLETVKAGKSDLAPLWSLLGLVLPPLIEGIFRGKQDHRPDALLDEVRREIAALKNQAGPVTSSIADTIRAIREIMEARSEIMGGGNGATGDEEDGEKNSIVRVVEKGIDMLARAQSAQPAASRQVAPGPRQPQPEQPMTTQLPADTPLWHQVLVHYRDKILEAAKRGIDPAFAADIALQFMDPEVQGIVDEFVKQPNRVAMTFHALPELREFEHWVGRFWKAVEDAQAEEEPEEETQH